MKQTKRRAPTVPLLYVCVPSPQADATTAVLQAKGMAVTRAENVCYAEIYADEQHFRAAVYDISLSQEEQVSLARVMRIRWPWMRILRLVPENEPLLADDLFDWTVHSEPELAACVELRLSR